MRSQIGNPFREGHGRPHRIYDWVAPPIAAGVDFGVWAGQQAAALEAVLAGITLRGDSGTQRGYLLGSLRPGRIPYWAMGLYDTDCVNDPANCPAGHVGVLVRAARALTPAEPALVTQATGEHAQHRLGVGRDTAVLRDLGFTLADGPLRGALPLWLGRGAGRQPIERRRMLVLVGLGVVGFATPSFESDYPSREVLIRC